MTDIYVLTLDRWGNTEVVAAALSFAKAENLMKSHAESESAIADSRDNTETDRRYSNGWYRITELIDCD